jgi:N-acetylglucosamine-6-phosphate deacetylase
MLIMRKPRREKRELLSKPLLPSVSPSLSKSGPLMVALCDATLFTGEAMVDNHALIVKDGRILDILANHKIPSDMRRESYGGHILAPGFIDAQVNGGGNILFNNQPVAKAAIAIATAHEKYGTTRLLLTCMTDTPAVTAQALSAMREARHACKNILGIHFEGPHIAPERRGVHNADYIRALDEQDLSLYMREGDEVIVMTVAPETATPDQIRQLVHQGVIVSLGHTEATHPQIKAALAAGARGFTHLFNGMGGLSARQDTPASLALDDRDSWCSIIADGHHVSQEMIRLAIRAKAGKIYLVSDAMPPAASGNPQEFQLYGKTIAVEKNRCTTSEGTLAGASITMADAVRHCIACGIQLEDALRMASSYPALFLGIDKRLGKLLPGFEAAIVTLKLSSNGKLIGPIGPPIGNLKVL